MQTWDQKSGGRVKDSTIIALVAICAIVVLEITAVLFLKLNATLLSLIVAVIAAIAGVEISPLVRARWKHEKRVRPRREATNAIV